MLTNSRLWMNVKLSSLGCLNCIVFCQFSNLGLLNLERKFAAIPREFAPISSES